MTPVGREKCDNCGDGSGWSAWYPRHLLEPGQPRRLEWVGCADCNDDGRKPTPELCERCGETQPFCTCSVPREKESDMTYSEALNAIIEIYEEGAITVHPSATSDTFQRLEEALCIVRDVQRGGVEGR